MTDSSCLTSVNSPPITFTRTSYWPTVEVTANGWLMTRRRSAWDVLFNIFLFTDLPVPEQGERVQQLFLRRPVPAYCACDIAYLFLSLDKSWKYQELLVVVQHECAQHLQILSISYLEHGQVLCGSIPLTDFQSMNSVLRAEFTSSNRFQSTWALSECSKLTKGFTSVLYFFSIDNNYRAFFRLGIVCVKVGLFFPRSTLGNSRKASKRYISMSTYHFRSTSPGLAMYVVLFMILYMNIVFVFWYGCSVRVIWRFGPNGVNNAAY